MKSCLSHSKNLSPVLEYKNGTINNKLLEIVVLKQGLFLIKIINPQINKINRGNKIKTAVLGEGEATGPRSLYSVS